MTPFKNPLIRRRNGAVVAPICTTPVFDQETEDSMKHPIQTKSIFTPIDNAAKPTRLTIARATARRTAFMPRASHLVTLAFAIIALGFHQLKLSYAPAFIASKFSGATMVTTLSSTVNSPLRYSSEFPANQAATLNQDLQRLGSFAGASNDPATLKVFESSHSINGAFLQSWLQPRARLMVSDKFHIDLQTMETVQADYPYEHPGMNAQGTPAASSQIKLTHRQRQLAIVSDIKTLTLMTNIGGAAYGYAKLTGDLKGLTVPGLGKIVMSTPRVGLIVVGAGTFRPLAGSATSVAASYDRLSTLFHEARHSDGNGTGAGFFHATCPASSPYAGLPACDANRNGPYTIGAMTEQTFAEHCAECKVSEREALRLAYVDSFARIIKQIRDPNAPDMEEIKRVLGYCDTMKKNGESVPPLCAEDAKILADVSHSPPSMISTTFLDATPEGKLLP